MRYCLTTNPIENWPHRKLDALFFEVSMYKQRQLIGKIAALLCSDAMRTCAFEGDSFRLRGYEKPKCPGRTEQVWASQVYDLAMQVAEDHENLELPWPPNQRRQRSIVLLWVLVVPSMSFYTRPFKITTRNNFNANKI